MTPDPTATPEPDFVARHIGPDEADVAAMLKVVGQPSVAALLDTALPRSSAPSAPSPSTPRRARRR